MSYIDVQIHYETSFSLVQHHKYSITELDNMIPWEREVFLGLLVKHLKEEMEHKEREARRN